MPIFSTLFVFSSLVS